MTIATFAARAIWDACTWAKTQVMDFWIAGAAIITNDQERRAAMAQVKEDMDESKMKVSEAHEVLRTRFLQDIS